MSANSTDPLPVPLERDTFLEDDAAQVRRGEGPYQTGPLRLPAAPAPAVPPPGAPLDLTTLQPDGPPVPVADTTPDHPDLELEHQEARLIAALEIGDMTLDEVPPLCLMCGGLQVVPLPRPAGAPVTVLWQCEPPGCGAIMDLRPPTPETAGAVPVCPHCGATEVQTTPDTQGRSTGNWICLESECTKPFTVLATVGEYFPTVTAAAPAPPRSQL